MRLGTRARAIFGAQREDGRIFAKHLDALKLCRGGRLSASTCRRRVWRRAPRVPSVGLPSGGGR